MKKNRLQSGHDLIFLEVKLTSFDLIIENLIPTLNLTPDESIFEINGDKCHHLRMLVPRFVSEVNQRRGVKRKGTDVQVPKESFETLLEYYRDFSTKAFPITSLDTLAMGTSILIFSLYQSKRVNAKNFSSIFTNQ